MRCFKKGGYHDTFKIKSKISDYYKYHIIVDYSHYGCTAGVIVYVISFLRIIVIKLEASGMIVGSLQVS